MPLNLNDPRFQNNNALSGEEASADELNKVQGVSARGQIQNNQELLGGLLASQEQGIQNAGGGFGQALSLEKNFLQEAEGLLDTASQEKRFASVRESLLGERERSGLFGGTGDENLSIQGLSQLDNLRRQDINQARNLTSQSFFNSAGAGQQGQQAFGGPGAQGFLQNQQFQSSQNFQREQLQAQADNANQQAIGGLIGTIAGAYLGNPALGAVAGQKLAGGGGTGGGGTDGTEIDPTQRTDVNSARNKTIRTRE